MAKPFPLLARANAIFGSSQLFGGLLAMKNFIPRNAF